MSAHLRCAPWIRKALSLEDRAEIAALPADLTVYLWPSPQWRGRTWFAKIGRGTVEVASTAGHPDAMSAFRAARAQLAERVG
jgi:hypothetical protein